eukprot:gene26090-31507_t
MPFYLAPRFGIDEEKVFHAPILANVQADANETRSDLIVDEDRLASFRVDPEVDFRVGLSFDKHQHEISWITVYDAAMRRTLQKLEVEFGHDSYDVLGLQYKAHYGPRIEHIDPSHPSLRGFKISFKFTNVAAEDFSLARRTMFSVCVAVFVGFFVLVLVYADQDAAKIREEAAASRKIGSEKSSLRR